MERDPHAWRWVGIALLLVVMSTAAAVSVRAASGALLVSLMTVQVVATAAAWLIPQWRQIVASRGEASAEEREQEVRVETRVAINDALDPVLALLGELAHQDAAARGELRARAVPLVLATAAEFVGPPRSRACWFSLEDGPPMRLVPSDFFGRAGSPTTEFVAGTRSGDATIGMVLADEDHLCDDILADPPPGWDDAKDRDYRCFISVSVIAGDTAYGMVTLDAVEPGSLTTEDLGLLRLMAGLLAVALSHG